MFIIYGLLCCRTFHDIDINFVELHCDLLHNKFMSLIRTITNYREKPKLRNRYGVEYYRFHSFSGIEKKCVSQYDTVL